MSNHRDIATTALAAVSANATVMKRCVFCGTATSPQKSAIIVTGNAYPAVTGCITAGSCWFSSGRLPPNGGKRILSPATRTALRRPFMPTTAQFAGRPRKPHSGVCAQLTMTVLTRVWPLPGSTVTVKAGYAITDFGTTTRTVGVISRRTR